MFCLYGNHQIKPTNMKEFSDNDSNVSFPEHYSRGQNSETNNENVSDQERDTRELGENYDSVI